MSLLGKWLLIHCDNNLNINLQNHSNEIANLGFRVIDIRIKALLLGIEIVG